MDVTVLDMAAAREYRAARQREMLENTACGALISFTMNIAGPEKDNALIREGMAIGERCLEQRLHANKLTVLRKEKEEAFTGGVCLYAVAAAAEDVKRITVDIEEKTPAGRLYDLDVLTPDGRKIERRDLGLSERKCLLCGRQAQICARSRSHSLEELRKRTCELLQKAVAEDRAECIAGFACEALLDEVLTSPKPGLVDRNNNGSHKDMDLFTFAASTAVLYPYFYSCGQIGAGTAGEDASLTFERIREAGKLAEERMLQATGGVNTHKGAIFSLGILAGAAGRLGRAGWQAERLRKVCAEMAAGVVERDFDGLTGAQAATTGEHLYLTLGIEGVRGEAQNGFPLVFETGYPRLKEGLQAGLSLNDAGYAALLAVMSRNTDTNVIHRSSMEALTMLQERVRALLEGNPFPAADEVERLDNELIRANISPGGSADVLAMCYMVRSLENAAE